MNQLIKQLHKSVIVSCQARSGEPFDAPHFIAEFAKSAVLGGAAGLRIDRRENIQAVKETVNVPVIGIRKRKFEGCDVYITPSLADVMEVVSTDAEIVGMDGTIRRRPRGLKLKELTDYCHHHGKLVLADIATESDAEYAIANGADFLATTLLGYTEETQNRKIPDMAFLNVIVNHSPVPVFLEGGVTLPEQVKEALHIGAHGVIVGKAITMPHFIVRQFVEKTKEITAGGDEGEKDY